jgi:hypothetical protein
MLKPKLFPNVILLIPEKPGPRFGALSVIVASGCRKRRVRDCVAGSSGGFLPPSPPAEKATAR